MAEAFAALGAELGYDAQQAAFDCWRLVNANMTQAVRRRPITFLVAVSGVTIAGVGSAFWGVVAGSLALFVQHYGKRRSA